METLESDVKNCEIEVKSGVGDDGDVYACITSQIPSWAKTANDPIYKLCARSALEIAKKIASETGKDLTLRVYSYLYSSHRK